MISNKQIAKEHNSGKRRTYRGLVFVQDLIILRHGDTENDRRYIFEAVDPFLSFRSLTAHIKQSVKQLRTTKLENSRQQLGERLFVAQRWRRKVCCKAPFTGTCAKNVVHPMALSAGNFNCYHNIH
jgi:hypothetical protein